MLRTTVRKTPCDLDLWLFNPKTIPLLHLVWTLWDHSFLSYAPDKQTDTQTNRRTRTSYPRRVIWLGICWKRTFVTKQNNRLRTRSRLQQQMKKTWYNRVTHSYSLGRRVGWGLNEMPFESMFMLYCSTSMSSVMFLFCRSVSIVWRRSWRTHRCSNASWIFCCSCCLMPSSSSFSCHSSRPFPALKNTGRNSM